LPADTSRIRSLAEPRTTRTRIARTFDSEEVGRLKADVEGDLTVDGSELAAHALRAGLVDEPQMIVGPWLSAEEKGFFLMACGFSWSWSRSGRSATVCSFCDTPSARLEGPFQCPVDHLDQSGRQGCLLNF
jgi:hypothetical protein